MAKLHRLFDSFLLFMILIMSVLSLYGYRKQSLLDNELLDLNRRVTQNKSMGQKFMMLQDSIKIISGQVAQVDQMVRTDKNLTQTLKLVSHALPPSLTLTRIEYQKETEAAKPKPKTNSPEKGSAESVPEKDKWFVEMEGKNNQQKRDIKMSVADFVLELEKSGYFELVEITQDEMTPDSLDSIIYQFGLKAYLNQ